MPLHVGPRLHALTNGLFRSRDAVETRQLFDDVERLFDRANLRAEGEFAKVTSALSHCVCDALDIDTVGQIAAHIKTLIGQLIEFEGIWRLPHIDWEKKRETSEWWEIREELNRQRLYVIDFDATFDLLADALTAMLEQFALNANSGDVSEEYDLRVQTTLLNRVSRLPEALETILGFSAAEVLVEQKVLERLRQRFEHNVIVASGGNPSDPRGFTRAPTLPTKSTIRDPSALAESYLKNTPFLQFLDQKVDFVIPTRTRFEHMHIVAGTGHGKSQTLQYLIANDLPAVAAGKRSVVVIDSQGDLIERISQLSEFAPGGALGDRLVLIDPTDVEYPVSLNLFDVGKERLQGYDALERERLTNSILELYDFVLGSLLDAGMTQKQSVIFRYVTRLMLHIDGATIQTLRELMEEGSEEVFADDIAKLSGTAKRFFEIEFGDREFKQTRKQVLRRLWGILENQTFERMFSHPKSKLDLFHEMNSGKVILINTAKDLLKEQGTQIFGRFFIAMIAQAAQERATLPAAQRLPTFVYVDEAADYFDQNIGLILSQARKYNVSMTLAHQYLGQLDSKLQEAFGANTSIKMAGGVSAKDARTLAPMLYCQPDLIESQPKGSFATFVRGSSSSALPLSFPFGHMEQMQSMLQVEAALMREQMRKRYAVHISDLGKPVEAEGDEAELELADEHVSDPTTTSTEGETISDGVNTKSGESW